MFCKDTNTKNVRTAVTFVLSAAIMFGISRMTTIDFMENFGRKIDGEISPNWAKKFYQGFLTKIETMSYQDVCDSFMPPVAKERYREIYPFEQFPERYPKNFGKEKLKDAELKGAEKNQKKSKKYNPDQLRLF